MDIAATIRRDPVITILFISNLGTSRSLPQQAVYHPTILLRRNELLARASELS